MMKLVKKTAEEKMYASEERLISSPSMNAREKKTKEERLELKRAQELCPSCFERRKK